MEFEGNLKNVCQKEINVSQYIKCSNVSLKWMKYKNKSTFAYYSITFSDFKSSQSFPKTWQVLTPKKKFF